MTLVSTSLLSKPGGRELALATASAPICDRRPAISFLSCSFSVLELALAADERSWVRELALATGVPAKENVRGLPPAADEGAPPSFDVSIASGTASAGGGVG